ncbi:MAG: hypothetical protein J5710_14100 [Treponema sp.]|nr:hypothetical protein [Treponema sp.]
MARFMVKTSEYKNVCKAVNDRKLAELKKEIIEILKKQDEKEFKKAVDLFESQEMHYSHLEKSITGKWVEKAGYGVGTVRIWKGKKYKKIAPGKWARVFDKEGRGTNIAIGKLISKVQKIDNVEDLMALVMANKQRFVDENGVDLPVLDKLRAAVDARNGNVGNKGTSKIKNTTLKYDDNGKIKEVESTLIEPSDTARNFKYNKDKLSINELKDAKNEIDSYIQKLNKEISSLEKIKKENADKLTDNAKANIDGNIAYSKNIINAYSKDKADCEKLLEEKKNKPAEKEELSMKEKVLIATDEGSKKELGRGKMYKKHITEIQKIANSNINDIPENLKTINDFVKYQDSLYNPDYKQAGKDYARLKNHELAREIWQKVEDGEAEWDENGYLKLDENGLLAKPEKKEEISTKISVEEMKSMSDDELKDYEAKLEKELLGMNRNNPDFADKYNHWREVHGENNDRFHQRIEDEAKAEKQKESDAKAEKEKEIKEKYHGYFDSRSGLDKARDLKNLEKKFNFDGKVMTSKDFVEQAIDNGAEIKEREVNKLDYPSRTRWNRMNGYEQEQYERRIKEAGKKTVYSINGYEFPKTVVDYAKYYKENGKKGSGEEKSSLSDVAIKNRASSIASSVAYSKTYQEKMGAPFNMEVAESIIDDADDMDEPTKKAVREELKKLYSERKVQKSLDNQFLMDMFVEDEIQKVEEEQEEESLFDDYSAEQPGLFNSTAMKVQEAFNRCKVM